jgi:hypothetical protein
MQTTVRITLEGDALGFGATWTRNVAQALFSLGVNGVSFEHLGGGQLNVTTDASEATIRLAARAASVALTQELAAKWNDERVSYHDLIDQALRGEITHTMQEG